jgi:hypothetical protein
MASLSTKVKLYCAANSKTVDFTTDVLLLTERALILRLGIFQV